MSLKIIFDTNIFLDAMNGKRFDEIFETSHSIFVSKATLDIELSKYEPEIQGKIDLGKLEPIEIDAVSMKKCEELMERYPRGLTFCDISSLALALTRNLDHLATAENQLRAASKKEKIVPLYVLDLIGFLLEEGKLTKAEARKFYDDAFPRRGARFEKMIQEQLAA